MTCSIHLNQDCSTEAAVLKKPKLQCLPEKSVKVKNISLVYLSRSVVFDLFHTANLLTIQCNIMTPSFKKFLITPYLIFGFVLSSQQYRKVS